MYSFGEYILVPRFKFVDTFVKENQKHRVPAILLILLLRGSFDIKKHQNLKPIKQNIDYSVLGMHKDNYTEISKFIQNIDNNFDFSSNYEFYKTIFLEYIACLYANKKKHGIVSLIHIYRILERISYTLPLLYAKNSNDYKGTYNYFKNFFNNSDRNMGELSFLKKAINSILDVTEKRFMFSYELNMDEGKALRDCLINIKNFDKNILEYNDRCVNFNLSIEDSIVFLINIRNSFFHALSGKPHITLDKLPTPNSTFLKLTTNFINTLSFITVKTIESLIK